MYALFEFGILNAVTAGALALIVLAISRMVRRPAIIHALWVLVLLKLVTPPMVEVPVGLQWQRFTAAEPEAQPSAAPLPEAQRSTRATIVVSATPSIQPSVEGMATRPSLASTTPVAPVPIQRLSPVRPPDFRWVTLAVPVALGLWLAGALAWFLVQGWRVARFARFMATAELAPDEIQRQARALAARIGIRRTPQVWVVPATMSPFLWAMGSRARVIFPADLLARLDDEARATLIAHELAHYHRRDHWVRLLEFVVTGLFWWHPVVWLARREIEATEEHCCDAWVVGQFPEQPRRYAEALLDTIDFLSEPGTRLAPVASGLGQAPFLRQRLRLIMSGVAPKSMSGTSRLIVLALAAVCLPLAPQLFERGAGRADAALQPRRPATTTLSVSEPEFVTTDGTAMSPATTAGLGDPVDAVPPAKTSATAEELNPESFGPEPGEIQPWAIVNSTDGRFQVLAETNGGVTLRDTIQQQAYDLSAYGISSVAFVPHRDLLVAGSSDAHVYVFDCASGEALTTLAGHRTAVSSVAISMDGRYVASGSRDGAVKLWDIEHESELVTRIPAQASAINCVRFSPDGRLLALASSNWMSSDEGSIVVWDLRGETLHHRFTALSPVGALAFGPDRLIVAEWNGQATSWNLASGVGQLCGELDKDLVSVAAFAADAQPLLIAAADGLPRVAVATTWFQRMDQDSDGLLAWNEFDGPRSVFRKLDLNGDGHVSRDEVDAVMP